MHFSTSFLNWATNVGRSVEGRRGRLLSEMEKGGRGKRKEGRGGMDPMSAVMPNPVSGTATQPLSLLPPLQLHLTHYEYENMQNNPPVGRPPARPRYALSNVPLTRWFWVLSSLKSIPTERLSRAMGNQQNVVLSHLLRIKNRFSVFERRGLS